jgi:hypothetical protein
VKKNNNFFARGIDWYGILSYIYPDEKTELAYSAKPWGIFDWFGLKGCGFTVPAEGEEWAVHS